MIICEIRTGGRISDRLETMDTVEAEAWYLRHIQTRTDGPATVRVICPEAVDGAPIFPARYRLDRDWQEPSERPGVIDGAPREQEPTRFAAQWSPIGRPTVAMIRAVPRAAGRSRAQIAEAIGYTKRAWDAWSTPDDSAEHRQIPWAAYTLALVVSGLHPNYARR